MTPAHLVVRADVPVVPDAETARGWARDELAASIYHERPNLLETVIRWVLEQIGELGQAAGAVDVRTAALLVGAVVVVGVLVALLVAGPVRRARKARRPSVDVHGDDVRSAAELRASADRLADEGRWDEAVLDRYRAVLRGLEDRAVLDVRSGRTAHEAAEEAAVRLPACATDLRRAALLFDDVCYGDASAGPDDDAWLREVDRAVAETRPVPVEPAAEEVPA